MGRTTAAADRPALRHPFEGHCNRAPGARAHFTARSLHDGRWPSMSRTMAPMPFPRPLLRPCAFVLLALAGASPAVLAAANDACSARYNSELARIERDMARQAPSKNDTDAYQRWSRKLSDSLSAAAAEAEGLQPAEQAGTVRAVARESGRVHRQGERRAGRRAAPLPGPQAQLRRADAAACTGTGAAGPAHGVPAQRAALRPRGRRAINLHRRLPWVRAMSMRRGWRCRSRCAASTLPHR